MKISYAIPVCNELDEIKQLIPFLKKHKRDEDTIVILVDEVNNLNEVQEFVENYAYEHVTDVHVRYHKLNKDFAKHKNYLNEMCPGDWIFQLDADEMLNVELMAMLPLLIEQNPIVDAYWVSRINTVKGITDEHIAKWGWKISDKGWINFPDWQMRLYKNSDDIKWVGKVHEQLKGYDQFAMLPANESFAIYHPKDIKRQEKQNTFYDTI